ncbi:MAG: hypothetical protein EOP48_26395 [Sphingobacteriales bacterium]|nr:MAG: hypothetical protein EOP48_26395 [Sphingobacteriales bacterium]
MIIFSSLVNMMHAFQDRENLYLIMELMPGGDLRYHISKKRRFSEEQTSNNLMRRVNILTFFFRILCRLHCTRLGIFAYEWMYT